MKRFLKIFGITLASLLGLLLVVVLVTATVLCQVVFTPKKLTPIVQQVCDSLVIAPHEVGNVNLTLWHTFPQFGLEIDGLYLLNPMEGAQSDTLLGAPKVYVGINLQEYLDHQALDITSVELPDVMLNAYIAADGRTNFELKDLIRLSESEKDDTDSSATVLPFDVRLRQLTLTTRQLSFRDCKDSLDLSNLRLSLDAAAAADSALSEIAAEIRSLSVGWNDLELEAKGYVSMRQLDTIGMALQVETNTWNIGYVLRTIPQQYARLLPKEVKVDGDLCLKATVEGEYADSTLLPTVAATLTLDNAHAAYATIPVEAEQIEGRVTAFANLSDLNTAEAQIESLSLQTGSSSLHLSGKISDIMSDMLLDLKANGRIHLSDFASFLPEAYPVEGTVKQADLAAKIRLSDLSNMRLKRGQISGQLLAEDLQVHTDSMDVAIPTAALKFHIPATDAEHKTTDWMSACLTMAQCDANMVGTGQVHLSDADVDLCLSDILVGGDVICADLDIKSHQFNGQFLMTDSLGTTTPATAAITAPAICAYVEYDTKDTLGIPLMQAKLSMDHLQAHMDTIDADLTKPALDVRIRGGRRDKSQPNLSAGLSLTKMSATMGSLVQAHTDALSVKASARHTNNRDNILLEWNPRLDFRIHNAVAKTSLIPDEVRVPDIAFNYSNKDFRIDTSRIELGHSDFSLAGEIHNIGPWLEKKGLLTGQLRFISSQADINELLGYVSGMGNDEAELNAVSANEEAGEGKVFKEEGNPFIVPKGVDLSIDTKMETAYAFGQTARNLGGHVYIRDGVLIIEEMGFVCDAAKLQLTAMYKSPRRNHIFAGFDYHMTDIDIAALIHMIPQVDSILPMLRSFKGQANFHLAAETYLTAQYQIKPSTVRGACSISAKDLTLLDGDTFSKIAKILTFKKSTENKIDSIAAEMTLYKRQMTVYPFLVSCDKWMGAIGGQHYLDMTFDYHVNLLKPLYIGVGVSGSMDDLKIRPEKCIYAKDFRPIWTKQVDTESADIRAVIRRSLESNLK